MPGKVEQSLPPLAQYRNLADYHPVYGDFIVWSGWFTTWHGVVINYDEETNEIHVIFSGVPYLLFTLTDEEQKKETRKINLSQLKSASHGTYAVQQHDLVRNANVWFI